MRLLLLGMNHRTAPLEVRERFAVDDQVPILTKLVAGDEVDEAVLISTCNRVEVIVLTRRLEAARHRLQRLFASELGDGASLPEGVSLDAMLYEYLDSHAIRHLFRVTASIDSLVVGEPQITGQIKEAYRTAVECNACGAVLGRLLTHAFATAKRVRNETGIAERPVSVARVAIDLARQIFESFEHKSALLIGAGEMIELALERLRGAGLASVRVANRTRARAESLAERFGATAHALDELPGLLAQSDVVLSSIDGGAPILAEADFREALRGRSSRPIFVIDIGVPRNIDARVNDLDNVYLYDLGDLEGVAAANAEERRRETLRGEAIVLEERQRFDGWMAALEAVPTIRHLRARAEAIRLRELERVVSRLSLAPAQLEAVELLTRSIVNKLLHAPVSRLRREAGREQCIAYLETARILFALDDPEAPGAEGDEGSEEDGSR